MTIGNKEKFTFIEIIVIFFTDGKLQSTERNHYLGECELYGSLMKNIKNKFRDANMFF